MEPRRSIMLPPVACFLLAAATASSADLSVTADLELNGFAQGIVSAGAAVAPDDGVTAATGSGRIAIKPKVGDVFSALLAVEGWEGEGFDQGTELVTLAPVNADIALDTSRALTVAYATLLLGESNAFTISAGKADFSRLFDVSEIAGSQREQFVNATFRNSPTITYPGGVDAPRSIGAWVGFEAAGGRFECTVGGAEMEEDSSDFYYFGEARFAVGRTTHVGVYGWQANGTLEEWGGGTRSSCGGYGAFVDLELPITGDFEIFGRLSFVDGAVRRNVEQTFENFYKGSWSLGVCIGGGPWGRPGDSVGVALGVGALSDDYAAFTATPDDANESVLELYYRLTLLTGDRVSHRPSVELTPSFQAISDAGGESGNQANLWGIRLRSVLEF